MDIIQATDQQIETALASKSLAHFLRQSWHIIEPSTPLLWGRHLDAICEHLEAVTSGKIRNLIITVPPGCTKSITCSVVWPAWEWINHPGIRWLTAANDYDLVIRDAVACRRLIDSEWYRARWGHVFTLTSDQNVKGWYENSRRGYRTATTVGSKTTGKKGDRLLVDDPDDARKVDSETERKNTHDWWDKAFFNRVNDHKTGSRVVIGQRTHEDDLFGHIERQGGFERLNIPEEFEPKERCTTAIGWTDWREMPGDLMRADRFGPEQVREARNRLGSRGYSAQHNQKPLPDEGNVFKRAWFDKFVDVAPVKAKRCRYWDKAGTEGGGDNSAGPLLARDDDGIFYIEDIVKGKWSAHNRDKIILQTTEMDAARYKEYEVGVEQEPGSGGKQSAEYSVKQLAGYSVFAEKVTGEKVSRWRPLAAQLEAGNVKIVRGPWNKEFIDELCAVTGNDGEQDDQADGASGAFNRLALVRKKEFRVW